MKRQYNRAGFVDLGHLKYSPEAAAYHALYRAHRRSQAVLEVALWAAVVIGLGVACAGAV
tara:strand:+ start:2346 stop:2525 length:180 start_codon:yes stop_codon:yes gene_type:complete